MKIVAIRRLGNWESFLVTDEVAVEAITQFRDRQDGLIELPTKGRHFLVPSGFVTDLSVTDCADPEWEALVAQLSIDAPDGH